MDAPAILSLIAVAGSIAALVTVRLARRDVRESDESCLTEAHDPFFADHCADLMRRLYAHEGSGCERGSRDGR